MSKLEEQTAQVEELYREAGPAVLGYLTRRVATTEEAADLLGEVLVVLWRRRSDLPPAGKDRLWLFVIARNVLANHRRRTVRHRQAAAALNEQLRTVATGAADTSRTLDLHAALDNLDPLDPLDRDMIQLFIWERFTSSEIGTLLDMPPETVRTRLRRARERLRHDLDLPDDENRDERRPVLFGHEIRGHARQG